MIVQQRELSRHASDDEAPDAALARLNGSFISAWHDCREEIGMVAARQAKPRKLWAEGHAPVTALAEADSSHPDVMSPAMALQTRLGAALASADGIYAVEPAIAKWSGATRIAILLGAASASWVLVLEIAKYLI